MSRLNRRQIVLGGAGAAIAAAAQPGAAQQKRTTLRFWTSQGAPAQMAVWRDIFQQS